MKNVKLFEEFLNEKLNMKKMIQAAGKELKQGADSNDLQNFVDDYLAKNGIPYTQYSLDQRISLERGLEDQFGIEIEHVDAPTSELVDEPDPEDKIIKAFKTLAKKYKLNIPSRWMSATAMIHGEVDSEQNAWSIVIKETYGKYGRGGWNYHVVFDPKTKIDDLPSQRPDFKAGDELVYIVPEERSKYWKECLKEIERWIRKNI